MTACKFYERKNAKMAQNWTKLGYPGARSARTGAPLCFAIPRTWDGIVQNTDPVKLSPPSLTPPSALGTCTACAITCSQGQYVDQSACTGTGTANSFTCAACTGSGCPPPPPLPCSPADTCTHPRHWDQDVP